ncbi:hypothetical protein Tdes44962_MAKER08792 [Teratosphaeria destructans]|uniref:Fungal N-terminal domain-containing protein n=1 Tax=Teratosphaeria destructans TaxID=418781 RepID=A0A9W7SW77_9PEZI|nr:hypothetical protein Tdes44962_MAKER08792 [Teratosphaeria destructans]
MAEVLGTAASALQVISIGADLGHALWKYAADFRKAGDDITAIALETDAIVKALRGLQPLLDEPGPHQSTALLRETAEVLSGCRGVFNELKAGLESWTRKGGNGKLPFWVRAQWPFRKQRLVVLQDMLSRYGQVLSLMLAVVQFAEGKKLATKEDLESLQTQLERLTLANQTLATSNETL